MKSYQSKKSAKTSRAQKLSITLPADLGQALQKLAKNEHRTLSGLLQEAGRYFLSSRRYESLQNDFARQARVLGITNESDIEALLRDDRSER